MVKIFLKFLIVPVFLLPAQTLAASLVVVPENPIQGEPIMISIVATGAAQNVQSFSFDGKKLGIFTWKNQLTGLYGIDLYKTPGIYKIKAILQSGEVLEREIVVGKRKKVEVPLDIPQKLGGNTQASAKELVSTLAQENAGLLGLRTGSHAFWKENFVYPIADPIITDTYGYQRQTGGYSIAHKGVDFRAVEGIPVLAMNRGVVRIARWGRNYGNTIVVDHGLGLQTFYMHLSKIKVNEGELVLPKQIIGLSGQTGYAEKSHLHITVRINDISIDPVKFIEFFKY
ncbi:MAG: M23 family metallopeptidase [Patescibacteria group bacterium]